MGIGVRGLPEGTSPSDLEELNTQQIIAFLDKLGEWRCTKALHESTCRLISEGGRLRGGGGPDDGRGRPSPHSIPPFPAAAQP